MARTTDTDRPAHIDGDLRPGATSATGRGGRRGAVLLVLLAAMLVLSATLPAGLPFGAPALVHAQGATGRPAASPPRSKALTIGEQADRRTQTSTTRYNGGKSFTTTLYQGPVNYRDSGGHWQPIANNLVPDTSSGYAYRNQANSFVARFGQNSDSHLLSFSVADGSWRVQLDGARSSVASVRGSTVSYAGVLSGANLQYAVGAAGVEETLTLDNARAPGQYAFTLQAPSGVHPAVDRQPNGSWVVRNVGSPEPLFVLDAPVATDAAAPGVPAPASARHATLKVSVAGGLIYAVVAVDATWLHDPSRAFPVRVDPTVSLQPETQDGSWAVCTGCTSSSNTPALWVGSDSNSLYRSAVQFSFSGMPAGATVQSAQLGLYYDDSCIAGTGNPQYCNGTSHTIDAHQVTAAWTQATTSDQMQFNSSALSSATLTASSLGSPQWLNWDITSLFDGWLGGTTNNDGIELLHNPESLGLAGPIFPSQYSTSVGPTYFPKITVTYTSDAVTLLTPTVVHSNGAELNWTAYSSPTGNPFSSNAIYRSLTHNFTPSPSTLVTSIADPSVLSYTDTTAAPTRTYYYKMVTNGTSWSPELPVTTPADGTATLTLQPDPVAGKTTWIAYNACSNYGSDTGAWVGSGPGFIARSLTQFDLHSVPTGATVKTATLSMYDPYGANGATASGTIHAYRVTRAWTEGTGTSQCTGDGATWTETVGGTLWTNPGGDFDPTADGGSTIAAGEGAQWHTFDVAAIAQNWASGTSPDLGILLKEDTEPQVSGSMSMPFASDDWTADPTQRPTLTMTYIDGSHTIAPSVAVASPGSGATVSGSAVALTAAASDDGVVTQVQYFVDGTAVGAATAAPWQVTWNSTSVASGTHTITAKATDNAGNVTTSAGIPITVGNYGLPIVSITAPGANASLTGTVTVTASASAPSGTSVSKVDLYVDNTRLTSLTAFPYTYAWNTLDGTAYDGSHTLSATAYDADGETSTSSLVAVTLTNTSGSQYQATFAQTTAPQTVVYDPNSSNTYTVPVTVTNTSKKTWSSSSVYLCYRWVSLDTASSASADQATPCAGGLGVRAGKSGSATVTVPAPPLGQGVHQAQYQLWFDLYDSSANAWFSAKGNQPNVNWVTVNLALKTALGLETYYQYTQDAVGGGMEHMVNVANGNSLLTWTPFSLPGRGLSTVVQLTYNSREDHSDSLAGNNWSLSTSSLTRFGLPLDIHTGGNSPWIGFTDGDGTYHRFQGATDSGGNAYYVEPPGVHLYLRQVATDAAHWWALTRPDRTTFFYNQSGFPTFVTDKNGNSLTFTESLIQASDDPGNVKYHVTAVTDAGGRAVTISYYTHATAPRPKLRGLVSSIVDHDGHEIDFSYNDDGNLAQLTQRGGTNADGSFLADRNWSFTYTASGDGTSQALNTASESTKIYSVTDPLGHKTLFTYISSGQDKWKIASETDRVGSQTNVTYNDASLTTTVAAPLSRTTSYVYDSTGQPTSIQRVLNGTTTLTTGMQWSADFAVTAITDPSNHTSQSSSDNNGLLTDQIDQDLNHTKLAYQMVAVDSNDASIHWCPTGGLINGYACAPRTEAHISQLQSKTDPNGVAAGSGFVWQFAYDANGNLKQVTDPNQHSSSTLYNTDGTVSQTTNANGNITKYTVYDANGLATTVIDPLNNTTTKNYDADGRLQWTQDPNHQSGCPQGQTCSNINEYRAVSSYDSFGRLGMTSQPKSTQFAFSVLILTKTTYDANNNVVAKTTPYYSTDSAQNSTTTTFDGMDQQILVTGPDTSADPAGERTKSVYDAAGRLTQTVLPVGMQNGTPNNTHTVNYAYDNVDRRISQTVYHVDSGGTVHTNTTLACYDSAGNVTSMTQPSAGLSSVACPAAPTTPFTSFSVYDPAHRVLSKADADGHKTSSTYDADGNVLVVTDPSSNTTTNTYDQLNRLTRIDQAFITGSSPHAVTTEYQYDNIGNRTEMISPRAYDTTGGNSPFTSYVTISHYDGDSHLVQTDLPIDSAYPTQYHVLQCYDANGNQTVISKPVTATTCASLSSSQETTTQYLDPGWIYTNRVPGAPAVLHYDYNAQGQQIFRAPETSPGVVDTSKEMSWAYYADGQVKQTTDSENQPVSFTYSADDVLATTHNASGLTDPSQPPVDTQNTINDLDQVIRTDEKQQTASTWTFSSYAFDADNNMTDELLNGQESSPNGTLVKAGRTLHLDYDQAAWLTDQYDCGTSGVSCGPSSSSAGDQRILEQFTPTGRESQRELDKANGANGWTKQQLTTWDYFANGKLDHLTTSNGAGSILESHTVSYLTAGVYNDGNRTQDVYTMQQPSGTTPACSPSSCSATYTYDPRDNLVATNDGHGTATTYSLDPAGNILTEAQNGTTTKTYTYNGDQITTLTSGGATLDYWYDSLGRQSCITTSAGSNANCNVASNGSIPTTLVAAYGYDYLDRMSSYRAYSNGTQTDSASYVFDALNRASSETETHPGLSGPRTTQFSYVGLSLQLTQEQQSSAGTTTETKDYSYDPNGHVLSLTDTPYTNGTAGSPTAYSYGSNVHSSVSLLVDPNGGVKASYGYQPYGQADTSLTQGDTSTTSPLNPIRYGSQRFDSGSKTYGAGVRNFSPDGSHFLTGDVFFGALADLQLSSDPLTQNRYALAGGNPLSYIDWSGHMATADGSGSGASIPLVTPPPKAAPAGCSGFCPGQWFAAAWKPAVSIAAGVATFSGCEALTLGIGTVGCAVAAGAVGGGVSGALNCGSNVAGCVAGGAAIGGVAGGVTAGLGELAAPLLSRAASSLFGRAAEGVGGAAETSSTSTALRSFYPPNNGFLRAPERQWLMPGQAIDRFGGEGGRFASPLGTSLEARALPPGTDLDAYGAYQVAKPFEALAGSTSPAFDQLGLGTQFMLPRSVGDLVRFGFLEPFEQ